MTVRPVIIPPSSPVGQYVAVSPPEYRFRIGATGNTRDEAETGFAKAVRRWEAIDLTPEGNTDD